MIENKSLIYGLVIISGFILVWLIYADQGIDTKPDLTENETSSKNVVVKANNLTNAILNEESADEPEDIEPKHED